ncbi:MULTISPECIES: hypothetical protein [Luteimonas]|uniref:Uncharacterized protein n=1 Tax=Luteimonas terrae TaxID=1530191 RepID=A0ABU1XZ14_9GAMM|nr:MULTISPECIES: hypothetical protein [Luteimonas]MDR6990643.1 hypothetical protein [Luteimonas sp. 3794]MDR7193445.1 hypothetical protein [Luteimonas terrae]
MLAALGVYSLYIGGAAIASLEVATFTRFNRDVIVYAVQPVTFCLNVMLWLAGGLFLIGLAVFGWRTAST